MQLVSNRHGVIESYQYQRLTRVRSPAMVSAAVESDIRSLGYAAVEYESFVMALTADSVEAAADFDAAIERNVPSRYVSDPTPSGRGQALNKRLLNGWRMSRASLPLRNSTPR